MLAKHVFKYIGKNVKIFHGVEVSYGYNLTVEDNCTIHKYVLLDDRGEIVKSMKARRSPTTRNVYSHEHDLNDGMIVTNTKTEIGPKARTYHSTVMSGVRVHEHGLLGSMGIATKDIPP